MCGGGGGGGVVLSVCVCVWGGGPDGIGMTGAIIRILETLA